MQYGVLMKLYMAYMAEGPVTHPRLAEIECDLGISGFQKPLWNEFVETLKTVSATLSVVDAENAADAADHAPSLPSALRARFTRLAAERKGLRDLMENAELLYRALTPQQIVQADRLLLPLYGKQVSQYGKFEGATRPARWCA